MINKELLKEIIVSNEEFILNQVKGIIKREGIIFPDFPDSLALYIDFEDERLADFETKDFERLKEAFLELKPRLAGANRGTAKEKEMIFLFLPSPQNFL